MEVAGAAFPITPLLATCTKIVTILHNVGKKFKRAPLMMTSIATECSLIHVALAQLRSFDWAAVSTHADGRQEQLTRATESIILGCTLTLSVIEEYAIELQDYVDGTPISPTEQMGIMARVRVLWKEDEMRELLLQLRGYQTGLTSLIRAAQDSDFGDGSDVSGSNYTLLLQRSRSSRARKPLSIRAAMQQAATYTSMSRSTTSSNHSSQHSTSTVQSRQSTAASSITNKTGESKINNGEGFSSIMLDSYDGGANASASKKTTPDNARRKRPAFLSLQPEEFDSASDGQTLHTKKSKDQMRKSSPTVGDRFRFVPGAPPAQGSSAEFPPKSAPPTVGHKNDLLDTDAETKKAKSASKDSFIDPPISAPPTAPLPEPPPKLPSRSPSRSRSPVPKSPVKSILRNSARKETSSRNSAEPRKASSSPPKQVQIGTHARHDGPLIGDSEAIQPPTPPTPQTERSFPTMPRHGTPQPRRQKSNSSVRDQIMVLPETARLRKQASNDLLRKQSSTELLRQTGFHDTVPALPPPSHDRYVVGNAFGRRGSEASQISSNHIRRTPSFDMLTDANRKRSVADAVQNASFAENKAHFPLQTKHGLHRSSSTVQRPAHLKFSSNADLRSDGNHHSPTSDAVSTPSTIATPRSQSPHSAASESWPLSPPQGYQPELAQHQSHYGARRNIQKIGERFHTRSPSHESTNQMPSRSFSPETTPRGSQSIVSNASTPRQRSRSNTLLTMSSEAGETEKHTLDEAASVYGSTAPSVMSAQWYRSPQERLDIGPRMSRGEDIPWELGDENPDPQTDQARSRGLQKPRLGSVLGLYPPRAPSRMNDDQPPQSPPRSPLLTDGFLTNVKAGLPKDNPQNQPVTSTPGLGLRPSTSMRSHGESDQSEQSKKSRKDKKKKESGRPTMRELWKEYKSSSDSWYTAQYQRAADEQRVDSAARDKRPATGSTGSGRAHGSMDAQASVSNKSVKVAAPRESTERVDSFSSESANSRFEKEKKKKKGGGFMSMKEMWGEYKANTNAWYTSAYKEENVRHLETPDLLGRRH